MSDVGVVGAGIVGLATAYALMRRGASVTVYERGVPGNAQSGGESRIFRHAHDDVRLVAMAKDSRGLWEEWSQALEVELVSGDGAVAIGPAVDRRLPILEEAGDVAVRRITPAEVRERLPILAGYDGPAMLDERGGAIRTTAAIRAFAEALGDRLRADEVIAVRPTGAGTVETRAGGATSEHDRVIVCAGTATAALGRGLGVSLPIREGAHVRLTYEVEGDPPPVLACLQDSSGDFGQTGVYAAAEPGNRRYAVGLSAWVDADAGGLLDPASLAEQAEAATAYVRRALPGLRPEPVDVRHCRVTELPWGSDGLAVWEAGGVLLAAGHNLFKLAPALGQALAAAALDGRLPDGLRPDAQLGRA